MDLDDEDWSNLVWRGCRVCTSLGKYDDDDDDDISAVDVDDDVDDDIDDPKA